MAQMMTRQAFCTLIVAFLAFGAAPALAQKGEATVVTVKEMCNGCVKQINKRLTGFPGVSAVSCDLKSKTITITPQPGGTVSSRALWEAFDEIGKNPVKMVTPQGTYTSKP